MDTEHTEHILGFGKLTAVWVTLLVLTVATVIVTRLDLGIWKVWAALAIACTKSGLVIAFFMHMKYEPRLFRVILIVTLFTLAWFIGFNFFDVLYR
uniref:Caa(3)-type oxidase, subunit IV n=1 Tax=Geobacter sp. (strain M21) TaxID=443144 RepID=C6E7U8_GEOSM